ncbi:MAG: hypothetical protein PHH44_03415 [bacterium]|jgi:hypothetical protein|nr:hypothetical protein [bacterium]
MKKSLFFLGILLIFSSFLLAEENLKQTIIYKMREALFINSEKYAIQDAYYSLFGNNNSTPKYSYLNIGVFSESENAPSFRLMDENKKIYEEYEFANDLGCWIDWWGKNGVKISYYITFDVPAKHIYQLLISNHKDTLYIKINPKYKKEAMENEKYKNK